MTRVTRYINNHKSPFKPRRGFAPNTANFISKLVFHPCSIPLTVYVETFIPCFLQMFLEQTIPFWDDLVVEEGRMMTRGRPYAGSKHYKKWKSGIRPEPETRSQRVAAGALKAVLVIDAPIEAIGWLMLIYGTVEEFYYNWGMLLGEFEHCAYPENQGPFQSTNSPENLVSTGTPQFMFTGTVLQNRGSWAHSNREVTVPFGKYSVTLSCSFTAGAPNQWYAKVGINAAFSIPLGDYWSATVTNTGPGTVTCQMQVDLVFPTVGGGTIQWLYESSAIPVGIRLTEPRVSIFRYPTIT